MIKLSVKYLGLQTDISVSAHLKKPSNNKNAVFITQLPKIHAYWQLQESLTHTDLSHLFFSPLSQSDDSYFFNFSYCILLAYKF